MAARVERDRHHHCRPGNCVAAGSMGQCIPRRSWYLRTRDASTGRRVSISFKSESEAREALAKLRAAEEARRLGLKVEYTLRATVAPLMPRFSEVAAEALKLYESTFSPRASTLDGHRGFLNGHLIPYFDSKPITSITTLEIQKFIAGRRTDLSDSTIKTSLPTLRLVLDHAVKLGLLATNPARTRERLWKPKASEQVDPFPGSELRRIIAAAREIDLRIAVLIQVLAQGGLRPGEGMALRRQDTNAAGIVHVTGSQGRRGRGPTKNTHSVRKVSVLHPVTEDRPVWHPQDAGDATRRVLDGLAFVAALAPDAESRLWPITATQFDRIWKRVLKAAGVRYRKPHALRHSFASINLSRGANVYYMVKAGGWKDATVLHKVYAKWMPEESEPQPTVLVNRPVTPRPAEAVESTW